MRNRVAIMDVECEIAQATGAVRDRSLASMANIPEHPWHHFSGHKLQAFGSRAGMVKCPPPAIGARQ